MIILDGIFSVQTVRMFPIYILGICSNKHQALNKHHNVLHYDKNE